MIRNSAIINLDAVHSSFSVTCSGPPASSISRFRGGHPNPISSQLAPSIYTPPEYSSTSGVTLTSGRLSKPSAPSPVATHLPSRHVPAQPDKSKDKTLADIPDVTAQGRVAQLMAIAPAFGVQDPYEHLLSPDDHEQIMIKIDPNDDFLVWDQDMPEDDAAHSTSKTCKRAKPKPKPKPKSQLVANLRRNTNPSSCKSRARSHRTEYTPSPHTPHPLSTRKIPFRKPQKNRGKPRRKNLVTSSDRDFIVEDSQSCASSDASYCEEEGDAVCSSSSYSSSNSRSSSGCSSDMEIDREFEQGSNSQRI